MSERRVVIYRGRVQGVGFRWQALRALEGVAVVGYVRNAVDGSVELVVEGAPEATREATARIDSALGHLIRRQTATILPATGEFAEFAIRR